MNYWLTVHWPARINEDSNAAWQNWIFLAEGWEASGKRIGRGDRVLIYETASAPRAKIGKRFVNSQPGRKGIIAVATVTTSLEENRQAEIEEYEDGRKRRWLFRAKTRTNKKGFLSLNDLRQSLGKEGFSARIPGGLMKLERSQFDSIMKRFAS